MSGLVLYYHAGSKNHGCEAIVRATAKVLNCDNITLFSSSVDEDIEYGLNSITTLKEDKNRVSEIGGMNKFLASVSHKLNRDDYRFYTYGHRDFFNQIQKGDICLSIGGDNYCYEGQDILGYYNKKLHKLGAKTVLWGCSVDPDMINDTIKKDLALYDLIVVRESISYNYLKSINQNTILCCDPAFQLDKKHIDLPSGFIKGKTIGINASPLAAKYGNSDLFISNYLELIRYIIENTDYQIALIPHVVKQGNDDRTTLQTLYDLVEEKTRMVMVGDMNCEQLKCLISECSMFVGARTHATIAAYSSCVSTLVTGYSVKAKGIAQELFGTDENYVVPVQSFTDPYHLKEAFIWLSKNNQRIKQHLEEIMPRYKESINKAGNMVLSYINGE